jgi:peptidoglycan/LPS O-acetylase OafA/YrhL
MNVRSSKQHYEVLDGLRGVAALIVVIFHFTEWLYPDYHFNPFGHSFLAVDFFFCLSGFVIGYAYDDRAGKISIGEFFKKRLIRLHPLVILGTVLGLLWYLFMPVGEHPETVTTQQLIIAVIFSLLMIPGAAFPGRFGNQMPLNSPAWSLFMEYAANIVYALILWRLPRRWLIPIVIIASGALIYTSWHDGNLMGGWSVETTWQGAARIFFSFTAGLLIHRFHLIIPSRLGFISLTILLVAGLLIPFTSWNWIAELLIAMIAWPLIISLGAGVTISDRMRKICTFSGNMSYPLYMTHYMVMFSFNYYYHKYPVQGAPLVLTIAGITALLIGFAYLSLKYFDEPVRAYLSRKKTL